MIEKNRNFSLPFPLSIKFDWREREKITSSGFKLKVGGFRVKFVKVCE